MGASLRGWSQLPLLRASETLLGNVDVVYVAPVLIPEISGFLEELWRVLGHASELFFKRGCTVAEISDRYRVEGRVAGGATSGQRLERPVNGNWNTRCLRCLVAVLEMLS